MKAGDQYEWLIKRGGEPWIRKFAPFLDMSINWMKHDVMRALDAACSFLKSEKGMSEVEINEIRDVFYDKFSEKSKAPQINV